MLISKANRRTIYEALFRDGVLVAKKDFNAPKHQDLDVPNLQVIKALQSLNSRGYVKTQFSWQYYYYSLTNEGIEYLREYLHLPSEIVPATFKKTARPAGMRPDDQRGPGGPRESRDDRDDYRRRDDGDRKEGATGDFKPEFVSSFFLRVFRVSGYHTCGILCSALTRCLSSAAVLVVACGLQRNKPAALHLSYLQTKLVFRQTGE